MNKATHEQTKTHNYRLVLKTIYDNTNVSRADVARLTGLTRPTVSAIVAELMDKNFVMENGQGPSAGGKPPTQLNLNENAYQLMGIDLSSSEFKGALINLRGKIMHRVNLPTNQVTGQDAVQLVYQLVDNLRQNATAPLLGIGIGTPGLVDPRRGIIRHAVNLGWQNIPMRDLLQAHTQLPIHMANDSHIAALAEFTFGEARESHSLVLVKIGQGIGAGTVLNGQPYYGDGFGAGEIGHVVVLENGEVCSCGNKGCLETVASSRALFRQVQTFANHNPHYALGASWEAVVAALKAGDPETKQLVQGVGNYLGTAFANLIGGFNIYSIVISGRISGLGQPLLTAVRTSMQQRVLPVMANETEISYSILGDDIVILGSSAMVLKNELGII